MHKYLDDLPLWLYVGVINLKALLSRKSFRIKSHVDFEIFSVRDRSSITICRRSRLHFYKKGVDIRINKLESSYLLDRLHAELKGAFIDCGANIGELGRFAAKHELDYHAFEPENLEAQCCDINNFNGEARTNRIALWYENTTLKFYSKADTADSSAIEISDYDSAIEVPARTLDSYISEKNISRIAVMKIEAEGAEPEVLSGATNALAISDFVVVECGFERGVTHESTLVPVLKIMTRAGFDVIDWNPKRVAILFKQRDQIA